MRNEFNVGAVIEIPEPPTLMDMRVLGFEPRNALSNDGLNVARLTTPAHPLVIVYSKGVLNYAL